MRFLLLVLLYCRITSTTFSQDIKKYIAENTKSISNIDTLSNDYSDLEPIGTAIGDARVVMLGEQDHGDAPAFLAKTRLIKYLHEKKGFNVLAFESDFYGLTKGWDELPKQPDSIRQFLKGNIFSIWTNSDACKYLFETYIPNSFQTKNSLQVAGFDSQMNLKYSYDNLKTDLNAYLTNNNLIPKFSGEANYQTFLNAVQELITSIQKSIVLQEYMEKIKTAQLQNKDSSYWAIVIDNLISLNNLSFENRDRSMADNLKFLVNKKYKGEKIIVWAANAHIMKYTDQIDIKPKYHKTLQYTIFKNMATFFTKDSELVEKTYVLGFSSYKGTAGRLGTKPTRVEVPNENGLENWIPNDIAFGFLNLKDYNKNFDNSKKPFLMKAPGHFTIPNKAAQIPWNLVYDGIFFIREMYPVQLLSKSF